MATAKTVGKTGFLKEFFVDHPAAGRAEINKAWQEDGNEGTISDSLIHIVRTELGLTGKGRVKAKAKQAVGAGKRAAAVKQPSAGRSVAKPVARGQSTTNGKRAAPGTELRVEPRANSGSRTRVLIEFEHRIDDLIVDAKAAGGLAEFEETLRRSRRILARSHGE